MQRIAQSSGRRTRFGIGKSKLEFISQRGAGAVVVKAQRQTGGAHLMPGVIERASHNGSAKGAEGMPVRLTNGLPINELDTEFVGGFGAADKIRLIDAQESQYIDNGRDGGLADADDADVR